MNKKKKNKEDYDFYQVLRVLYYFIDEESKKDSGAILEKMNKIKQSLTQLAADLGNLALLDNWYDRKKIGSLPDIVDFDANKGYSPKEKR
jgi:hypothetical protein